MSPGVELQPLNKSQNVEAAKIEETAPEDNRNLVFSIICLHGIGVLMPWNMLITISYDYFESYKMLANSTINLETGAVTGDPTVYSSNFQSFQTIASQVPNLLLNLLNIFIVVKGGLTGRITVGLSIVAVCVITTMAFIYVETQTWLTSFFVLTIATIIILNGANGVYQNSIFGLASELPFKYTNAVIIGNNLCGTFVTLLSMSTKAMTRNILDRAFAYFSIALITLIFCFISFLVLQKQRFYQFYSNRAETQRAKHEESAGNQGKLTTYIATFKEAFPMLINVFLVFFVTLSIFPGVMMYVKDEKNGGTYDFPLPQNYFMDVTTFLQFNVFAFIGSIVAGRKQWPSPNKLWIPVYLRLLYIPFFAFCNYLPETRTWPVFFESTWIFVIVAASMSFGSGYFSGLAMMYTSKSVDPMRAQVAGMMAGFFLISGIVSGLIFTMVIKAFVTA
ncbi:Protein CBG15231 [Caenorhabditis briggsae]|uniref:Uncharacterized protein n=3 Tax=Caenorhabditis briggsae TaxID=6238 RepID=A0AAE9D892_CAEBR|nr:Protein CBG15231 [Caenorhabditis briggsae]ULT98420.1 hypothetical protein L3Y34_000059 [Caenorhabditis briggsae]CAP33524.1 Protein CBG15231 [Caenorhabditis briggsae]